MSARRFWEEFRFDYRLEASRLSNALIAIEALRLSADHLVLAPEWREGLDRLNRVRAVYGTTALEGNPLSELEVANQILMADLQADAPSGIQSREQAQIRNASRAQEWVKKRFAPGSAPVSLGDILTMHREITRGSDEDNSVPGALRTGSVQVGSPELGGVHLGAPHERLTELMEQLIAFANSRRMWSEYPVIQALLAHFFLVTIHPFGDGNGRVSRLLESGILYRHGYNVHGFYGLSNFFYRNGDQYKTLLQQARRSPSCFELMDFVEFGVRGFAEELEGINNFIKAKVNRVMYRQMLTASHDAKVSERRRRLNRRELGLLLHLLDATEPTDPFSASQSRSVSLEELGRSGYIRGAYATVTRRTLVREFTRLAEMGFLTLEGDRAGELSVAVDFQAIALYGMA